MTRIAAAIDKHIDSIGVDGGDGGGTGAAPAPESLAAKKARRDAAKETLFQYSVLTSDAAAAVVDGTPTCFLARDAM